MKAKLTVVFSVALALGTRFASATELVKNGSFEAFTTQYTATDWTIPNLGTAPDGDPANYARVGGWAGQVGNDPYGYSYGPHGAGNGTGTQIPTRTVWMGGLNPRTSIIQQDIDTAGLTNGLATLNFKLVYEDEDIVGRDFLTVDFGASRVMTLDLGAGWVDWKNQFGVIRQGGPHFWVLNNPTIDLSPYLDGTTKTLKFTVINDPTSGTSSSAWIDNVSIQAQPAPEPATLAALGLGALALVRRRRRG